MGIDFDKKFDVSIDFAKSIFKTKSTYKKKKNLGNVIFSFCYIIKEMFYSRMQKKKKKKILILKVDFV